MRFIRLIRPAFYHMKRFLSRLSGEADGVFASNPSLQQGFRAVAVAKSGALPYNSQDKGPAPFPWETAAAPATRAKQQGKREDRFGRRKGIPAHFSNAPEQPAVRTAAARRRPLPQPAPWGEADTWERPPRRLRKALRRRRADHTQQRRACGIHFRAGLRPMPGNMRRFMNAGHRTASRRFRRKRGASPGGGPPGGYDHASIQHQLY